MKPNTVYRANSSTVFAVRHGLQSRNEKIYSMYLFAREPSKWQIGDVEHLGRLVFSLSTKQINSIPLVSTQKHQTMQILEFFSLHLNWLSKTHPYILPYFPLSRQCWIKTQWSRSWWVKVAGRTVWWVESVLLSVWTSIIRECRLRASFEGLSKLGAGGQEVQ